MSKTSIEWVKSEDGSAGDTWNPLAGCKEVSPGCTNCYAAVMAHRLAAMGQRKYAGTTKKLPNGKVVWTNKINLHRPSLRIPLERKKPTMYFVNSMADLFHEDVPEEFIDEVFCVMGIAHWHTFQVLTKRADRLADYMSKRLKIEDWYDHWYSFSGESMAFQDFPLPSVWLGVSVEDQQCADERIPHLLRTPAAVRFLSCEPLLGPIEFSDVTKRSDAVGQLGKKAMSGIDWCIVGGESGHGARPFIMDWGMSIIRQCKAAGIPAFMKQVGSNPFISEHVSAKGLTTSCWGPIKDSKGGVMEEWPLDLRVREFPRSQVPA